MKKNCVTCEHQKSSIMDFILTEPCCTCKIDPVLQTPIYWKPKEEKTIKLYKIVETDNFNRDYPDEKFVNLPLMSKQNALDIADIINNIFCNHPGDSA